MDSHASSPTRGRTPTAPRAFVGEGGRLRLRPPANDNQSAMMRRLLEMAKIGALLCAAAAALGLVWLAGA